MKYILLLFSIILSIILYFQGLENDIQTNTSNYIEIPSIHLNIPLYLGYSTTLLEKGLVIEPTNINDNNIIVYGHRFSNKNPLNKYLRDADRIKVGDHIYLKLKNHNLDYIVKEILTVKPSDTWVLSQTRDKILTIVTCTPIYNPMYRLIIISQLLSKY